MRRSITYSSKNVALLTLAVLILSGCQGFFQIQPSPTQPPSTPTVTSSPLVTTPTDPAITPTEPLPIISPTPNSTQPVEDLRSIQNQALLQGEGPELDEAETFLHYTIRLELGFEERTYQGHARVEYTNTAEIALDSVFFRLYPNGGRSYGSGSLNVSQVIQNNNVLETSLSVEDSALEVILVQSLAPGEGTTLEIEFAGTVPVDFQQAGYGIYNYTQGVMTLAGWYPHLAVFDENGWNLGRVSAIGDSVFSEMAFYNVEVSLSEGLVVVATGLEIERQSTAGVETIRYVSGPVRDFFITISPHFEKISQTSVEIEINSYYLPGDEAGGRQALEYAAQSVQFFDDLFGRYPYRKVDLVGVPLRYAAGVEFPGVILIAHHLYGSPEAYVFQDVVVHEVAHQWWYNLVGNDVINEPWLDEALATYSSALYSEHFDSRRTYEALMERFRNEYDRLVRTGQDAPVTAGLPYFENGPRPGAYAPVVYLKGALFHHVLREEIGDGAYFQALQKYYQSFQYRIATTPDLLMIFEESAGRDLSGLFEEWLFSPQVTSHSIRPTHTPAVVLTPVVPTPASVDQEAVRFAVIGDYGLAGAPARDIADLVKSWDPDFIITTGDNNYPNGAAETIDDNIGQYYHEYIFPYRGAYGEGADINRFFPVLGNHDYQTLNAQPYFDYFSLPGNQRYYEFTWGPLHFFALNSDFREPDGVGRSSIQAAWLRESLSQSELPWKIVYLHAAPYSSGVHGSSEWMRWPYAEWGASTVLAGHNHTYERLQVDGIPYFVNGLGGGPRYSFQDILPSSQVRFNDDYGAMLVTGTDSELLFEFYTRRGELIDSYTLSKPEAVEPGLSLSIDLPFVFGRKALTWSDGY
jgi:tartrate-resistant acid phosphatase type 5